GQYVRLDASGKVLKTTQIERNYWFWTSPCFLPKDHLLHATGAGEIVEYDGDGKVVWKANVPSPGCVGSVHRLRNGNTLVACFDAKMVVEINHAGKVVSEYQCPTYTMRAFRR